jgi:hypothetical protein
MPVKSIFSESEDNLIREHYPVLTMEEVMACLSGKFTARQIANRAVKLGVRQRKILHPKSENVFTNPKHPGKVYRLCQCEAHLEVQRKDHRQYYATHTDVFNLRTYLDYHDAQRVTRKRAVSPKGKHGEEWTTRQDAELVELYTAGIEQVDIAVYMGRTLAAIRSRLRSIEVPN